jgi:hypothetical protein
MPENISANSETYSYTFFKVLFSVAGAGVLAKNNFETLTIDMCDVHDGYQSWARWALELHVMITASAAQISSLTVILKSSQRKLTTIFSDTLDVMLGMRGVKEDLSGGRVTVCWEGDATQIKASATSHNSREMYDLVWSGF